MDVRNKDGHLASWQQTTWWFPLIRFVAELRNATLWAVDTEVNTALSAMSPRAAERCTAAQYVNEAKLVGARSILPRTPHQYQHQQRWDWKTDDSSAQSEQRGGGWAGRRQEGGNDRSFFKHFLWGTVENQSPPIQI